MWGIMGGNHVRVFTEVNIPVRAIMCLGVDMTQYAYESKRTISGLVPLALSRVPPMKLRWTGLHGKSLDSLNHLIGLYSKPYCIKNNKIVNSRF